jgi:hypothetical protein
MKAATAVCNAPRTEIATAFADRSDRAAATSVVTAVAAKASNDHEGPAKRSAGAISLETDIPIWNMPIWNVDF